jgi:beta-galactosidase
MHHDKAYKANALTSADTVSDFNIIQELGCNFIRLAHYPHTKVVYDTCDRLGIVVQTEVPWVNQSNSGQPEAYYTRLSGQCDDMVKQHYNHPCIFFWGLANEITPSTVSFTKGKIEQYTAQIKALDSERMVGFVSPMSVNNPTQFDSPNVDWFGYNIYQGWYQNPNSNDPTNALNSRVTNTITNVGKPLAYSEYGCGGTSTCHSDDFMNTTTRGNNPRHDIEYMMWLHEGHIAAIKNFPQLMFTSQWQLFDIAVYNRQEGYKVCLDGETVTDNDNLKYLNNKGLVERDHVTKKDTFYLYKAWWNTADTFVHICGKNYTKKTDRVIKCYTNQTTEFTLKVNGTTVETKAATDNILTFTGHTFSSGDVVTVESGNISDTFTFE